MRISYWSSDVCSSDLHVEALDPVNVLVNYWWNDSGDVAQAPWDAMLHAILAIRQLPPGQRRAWRANFDHYVFLASGNPGAHLPEFARGLLDSDAPLDKPEIRAQIIRALTGAGRSDEHTSELQSLMRIAYADFGLKKK